MKKLSQNLIEAITAEMKGKKLEKFLLSVEILQASAEQGGWVKGGSRRADSGFYQGCGIGIARERYYDDGVFGFAQAISYGSSYQRRKGGENEADVDRFVATLTKKELGKFSPAYAKAWLLLSHEKSVLMEALNAARPLPVLTEIKLSPKVTATLKECNLDLDLSSITYPELEEYTAKVLVWVFDKKANKGEWVEQERVFYRPIWPKGTVHNASRFAFNDCHACGKRIPSGRLVPFYADDRKSGNKVSMWVGCDCAKNIFGIKDQGVELEKNFKKKGA